MGPRGDSHFGQTDMHVWDWLNGFVLFLDFSPDPSQLIITEVPLLT